MGEFRQFIEERFGYDSAVDTAATCEVEQAVAVIPEDAPISMTKANESFMARFCRVL